MHSYVPQSANYLFSGEMRQSAAAYENLTCNSREGAFYFELCTGQRDQLSVSTQGPGSSMQRLLFDSDVLHAAEAQACTTSMENSVFLQIFFDQLFADATM